MELLDTLIIKNPTATQSCRLELYHGDLTNMKPEQAVDVLVVSAFKGQYYPARSSLIGDLAKKGVSVEELSQNKAMDLRANFSCWLSNKITTSDQGIQFKQILCFEPGVELRFNRGQREYREFGNNDQINPANVVGHIFQSLMPFVYGKPGIESVATPLVSTGSMAFSTKEMFGPLMDAAVNWLELGLPIKRFIIAEKSFEKAILLAKLFNEYKKQYFQKQIIEEAEPEPTHPYKHDIFISYSHQNNDEIFLLVEEIKKIRPKIRIFLDQHHLMPGMAWQQEIFEAIDDCRLIVTMYSPPYLSSAVCKEEFNIALIRNRNSNAGVLVPIYLHTANLPSYMQTIQYIDCREADPDKLKQACKIILQKLDKEPVKKPNSNL